MTDTLQFDKNKLPRFTFAGCWIRILAYLIDIFIISCIQKIIGAPVEIFLGDMKVLNIEIKTIVDTTIFFLYFILLTKLNNGQTLGKVITNIRVVQIYGDRLTWGQVITRELFGRYIQNTIIIIYIVIAFSSKRQSFADMLCDTVVVKNDVCDYMFTQKIEKEELKLNEQVI
ncbi:MAG: RDD family protein [Tissierellia bacterium]|nr:RDD family protein [Tissierellia bacterium]